MDGRRLRAQETRGRILDATRVALETRTFETKGMAGIADAAGITRAALYLHFPSKTELLLALVRHVELVEGLDEHMKPLFEPQDPRDRVHLGVELAVTFLPRIWAGLRALDEARHRDEAAAAAWNDRIDARRRAIRRVLKPAAAAGHLREGVSIGDAVDAILVLSGPHLYQDLVVERGRSQTKLLGYVQRIVAATILAPRR